MSKVKKIFNKLRRKFMKTYNIFISHAWDYNSDYYRLVEKLKNEPYFYFKNYSVPEHDALKTKTDKELKKLFIGKFQQYKRFF